MTPFELAMRNARRRVEACVSLGEVIPHPHTIQRIAIETGAPPASIQRLFYQSGRKERKE